MNIRSHTQRTNNLYGSLFEILPRRDFVKMHCRPCLCTVMASVYIFLKARYLSANTILHLSIYVQELSRCQRFFAIKNSLFFCRPNKGTYVSFFFYLYHTETFERFFRAQICLNKTHSSVPAFFTIPSLNEAQERKRKKCKRQRLNKYIFYVLNIH
jgi:hypothetical protein